jgi:hypothetical protein
VLQQFTQAAPFASFAALGSIQETAHAQPGVRVAGATQGVNWSDGRSSTRLAVQLVVDSPDVDAVALSQRLAAVLLERHAQAREVDQLSITVAYGYDIGIASAWRTTGITLPPAQWREHIQPATAKQSL